MPDPSPDWSFTFTAHPDGTSTSSARPPKDLDANDHALVSRLRHEAELLEAVHHDDGNVGEPSVAPDAPDLVVHIDRIVEIARSLQRNGLTTDEIASHASLSLTALERWLDVRR